MLPKLLRKHKRKQNKMIELYGDEFELGNLVVKYDQDQDIHHFYYKI